MGRVFVTGDIHASLDIAKLTPEQWPLGNELTRDDYLVISGDFGAVWGSGTGDGLLFHCSTHYVMERVEQ